VTTVSTDPVIGLKLVMAGNGLVSVGLGVTGGGIFGVSPDFLHETESIIKEKQRAENNLISAV
jgi:hypothetical protein